MMQSKFANDHGIKNMKGNSLIILIGMVVSFIFMLASIAKALKIRREIKDEADDE